MTPSMSDPSQQHRTVRRTVLVLAAFYAAWFSLYTCFGHDRFRTWAFDLGTFDQGIWLAGHGFDHFVTVRGLPLLGDHVRFFSFVLAPMYWIWDDARALLVAQSVAIAAGAWFLCRIGLRELPGRPWLVLSLCAGYLLNPAVQNLNLDHAHPDAFASTLILASVDFLRAGRMRAFAVAAALAMSCKEDVPLVFVAMGAALMLDRSTRRTGLAIASASGVYFVLCMAVILPYFNETGFFRYGESGFLASLWKQGHDPFWLLDRFTRFETIKYLLEIGLANLYLFLLAPLALVPAVPAVVANLVSDAWYMRNLEFHYHTSVVPFLYIATAQALARIDSLRAAMVAAVSSTGETTRALAELASRALALVAWSAPATLVAAAVVTNIAWSRAPISDPGALMKSWHLRNNEAGLIRSHALLRLIPKDAVVAADYSSVPHLSHRRFIYMLPNPFEVSNWGVDGENTHDPETVDYILLRKVHSVEDLQGIVDGLVADRQFERIAGDADVALYRRIRAPAYSQKASCGDWTGDGKITGEDLHWINEAIIKKRDCPPRVCDANGDGQLRPTDVLLFGKHRADPTVPLRCPP